MIFISSNVNKNAPASWPLVVSPTNVGKLHGGSIGIGLQNTKANWLYNIDTYFNGGKGQIKKAVFWSKIGVLAGTRKDAKSNTINVPSAGTPIFVYAYGGNKPLLLLGEIQDTFVADNTFGGTDISGLWDEYKNYMELGLSSVDSTKPVNSIGQYLSCPSSNASNFNCIGYEIKILGIIPLNVKPQTALSNIISNASNPNLYLNFWRFMYEQETNIIH